MGIFFQLTSSFPACSSSTNLEVAASYRLAGHREVHADASSIAAVSKTTRRGQSKAYHWFGVKVAGAVSKQKSVKGSHR